jgi:hypothetical protein
MPKPKFSFAFWFSFRLADLANADDANGRAAFEKFARDFRASHPDAQLPARTTAEEVVAARALARRVVAVARRWRSREADELVREINRSLPRDRRTTVTYVLAPDGSLNKIESMAGVWTWAQAVALATAWLIEDSVYGRRPPPRSRVWSLSCEECHQAFVHPRIRGAPAKSCPACRRKRHLRQMRQNAARKRRLRGAGKRSPPPVARHKRGAQ